MSSSSNGLVCFTNCLLPREDGSLVEKDLWIDERRGIILDAQVGPSSRDLMVHTLNERNIENLLPGARKTGQCNRFRREHPEASAICCGPESLLTE